MGVKAPVRVLVYRRSDIGSDRDQREPEAIGAGLGIENCLGTNGFRYVDLVVQGDQMGWGLDARVLLKLEKCPP